MERNTTRTIEVSKSGKTCLWEGGGSASNTGDALIIADAEGNPMRPLFVKTSGTLACANHALIVVDVGDVVIYVTRHREDYQIGVYRITCITTSAKNIPFDTTPNLAHLELIAEFENGEWEADIDPKFLNAVEAAKEKSQCYHCREPHYTKA